MRSLTVAAAAAVLIALAGAAGSSAAAPMDGEYRNVPDSGGAAGPGVPGNTEVSFTVRDGAVVDGAFYWPATCESEGASPYSRDAQFRVDDPIPIDANGYFRGEVAESGVSTTEPPPHPGYPWSESTTVEGTISGPYASGTAVYRSESTLPPGNTCNGSVNWSAPRVSGAQPDACADAKERVGEIKQKLENAEDAEKKQRLKKKLKKAKDKKQEACA